MDKQLTAIAEDIISELNKEWMALGRKDLTDRLGFEITEDGSGDIIWITDKTTNKYIIIQNKGVAPERIPFTPNDERAARGWERSSSRKSAYIQGLIYYAIHTIGASDKDAVSIACAIAHKHKLEGNPLDKGKLGFVERATDEAVKDIVEKHLGQLIRDKIKWQ